MYLKVFRHQPLGCYFEKSRDLSGTGMVCISVGGCINLPELKSSTVICIQISIECKDFDLDKTLILQNNIILRAIKTCINKGGVCTGKLVLLLLPLSPPLLPPHPSTADVIAANPQISVAFRCCHLHNKAAMELYHFWAFRSVNRCSWKPKKVQHESCRS